MKRIFEIFALMLATVFVPAASLADEGGELLWWMVGEPGGITGEDENGNIYKAVDLDVNSARIRYESDSGDRGYLTLWALDESGNPFQEPDGTAGVGIPAEYYGSLSSLSGSSTSYSFVLELGNWANGSWTGTSMESDKVSYTDLVAQKHIASWDNFTPVDASAWSPSGYHVVPEPNSAILVLLGSALLALRRRRSGGEV